MAAILRLFDVLDVHHQKRRNHPRQPFETLRQDEISRPERRERTQIELPEHQADRQRFHREQRISPFAPDHVRDGFHRGPQALRQGFHLGTANRILNLHLGKKHQAHRLYRRNRRPDTEILPGTDP